MDDFESQKQKIEIREKRLKNSTIWVSTLIPLLTVIISIVTTNLTIQNKIDIEKLNFTQERIKTLLNEDDISESRKKLKFLIESGLIGEKNNEGNLLKALNSNLINESESTLQFLLGVKSFDRAFNSKNLDTVMTFYTSSINYFMKALDLNPNNYEARSYLGASYNNLGMELGLYTLYEKALIEYDRALKLDSTIMYVHVDKAKTFENLEKYNELCNELGMVGSLIGLDSFRINEVSRMRLLYCNQDTTHNK
ncbi:hypothetical protein V6R21_24595 [Limibacter armeniacum]|uniref:tetratricopeptide repeat protein n=1 Tax=Limibacter armeniacum TaxID=466084 RepID=UPI002FE5F4C7